MGNLINLLDKRFGRLVVTEYYGKNAFRSSLWICKCDCGNTTHPISSGNLRSGHTQSCGCYQKDQNYITRKKYNNYNMLGECGIGYTIKSEVFYFDLEDFDKIKNFCWSLNDSGYVISNHTRMHRLLLDLDDNEILVDHKNKVRHDNRRLNLRVCSSKENSWNKTLLLSNTSGITGVSFEKKINRWRPSLEINGKKHYLGVYRNMRDAILARLKAEKLYYGEFAPQEHLFEKYNI